MLCSPRCASPRAVPTLVQTPGAAPGAYKNKYNTALFGNGLRRGPPARPSVCARGLCASAVWKPRPPWCKHPSDAAEVAVPAWPRPSGCMYVGAVGRTTPLLLSVWAGRACVRSVLLVRMCDMTLPTYALAVLEGGAVLKAI